MNFKHFYYSWSSLSHACKLINYFIFQNFLYAYEINLRALTSFLTLLGKKI